MMPYIKDHPDWQVCLTLDAFSSHLVPAGLAPFTAANITVIKEEGDTMQVNQAYNQSVAKEDKKVIRELLDPLQSHQKLAIIKQETIIAVFIDALRKVKPDAWVDSFKKVIQHPHFRVDFEQWCKRIKSKLATGERFFVNRVGLFDAMPAFWKQMSSENRHAVVAIIDGIMMKAKTNEENLTPWRIINVLELLKYVALDDLQQLRGCYHTCTIDPSVFVEPEPHQTVPIETVPSDHAFRWNPKIHVDAIRRETIRGKVWVSSWAVCWGKL